MSRQTDENEVELGEVLGGILHAVQEAKQLGDSESARLTETYRKEKSLSAFTVPAFAISEVEVELRFAVIRHVQAKPRTGGLSGLKVNITSASLTGMDSSQLQSIKLKISPVALRALERGNE